MASTRALDISGVIVLGSATTELVDAVEAKNGPGLRPGQPQRPLLQSMGQGNPIRVTCRGSGSHIFRTDHALSEGRRASCPAQLLEVGYRGGGSASVNWCLSASVTLTADLLDLASHSAIWVAKATALNMSLRCASWRFWRRTFQPLWRLPATQYSIRFVTMAASLVSQCPSLRHIVAPSGDVGI